MTRFFFSLLLLASLLGCQSVPTEPGKTILVDKRSKTMTPSSLWAQAVELLHPSDLAPYDLGTDQAVAQNKSAKAGYTPVSYQPGIVETPEPQTLAVTPPPRSSSSNQLYRPGSIFASPALMSDAEPSTEPPQSVTQQTIETVATAKTEMKTDDVLKVQQTDSERFRLLLQRIEETPPEQRNVNDAELARLLEDFRKTMQDETTAGLEANYLVILQKKILPNYRPAPKTPKKTSMPIAEDDDFDEELAAQPVKRRAERPSKPARRYRQEYDDEEDEEDWADREAITLKSRKNPRAPAPIPTATTQAAPLPPGPPVYPGLTQLDGTTPPPAPIAANQQAPYANQYGQQGIMPVNYVAPGMMPKNAPLAQGSWEQHSQLAAQLLRQQMETSAAARSLSNEARLRLLELVNGNRNEAVKPFTQVEKPFNDFWGNQILGFSALLDDLGHPDTRARYSNAAFRIDEGLMDLRRLCPIRLKNVRLARDVWAFGDYLPRSPECQAGEKVDVYLELENPTVRRTGDGFNVGISISYEIRDNSGSVIKKHEEPPIQSTSPSQRRDYYVHLKVSVPKELAPGSYHLRVNVTDLNDESMLFAEEQIPLTVLPADREKRAGNHQYDEPR